MSRHVYVYQVAFVCQGWCFCPWSSMCMSVSIIKLSLALFAHCFACQGDCGVTGCYQPEFPFLMHATALKSLFSLPLRDCCRSVPFYSSLACFVRVPIHRLWTFLLCQSRLPASSTCVYLDAWGSHTCNLLWKHAWVCAQGCTHVSECPKLPHVSMPPTAQTYS